LTLRGLDTDVVYMLHHRHFVDSQD
jgi:hypothetical protein